MNTQTPSTEEIWRELSADLLRFIRRRVSDEQHAEDLLQETFVRIHRNIRSLADADRLAAWVYQIARNVVSDHYRKSARAQSNGVELLSVDDPIDDTDDRPFRLSCLSSRWQAEFMAKLPETYREAVQLAEIEGLTQREVADRLGLSLSGDKSRIQRGRALLKEVLEACCRFEFDRRGNLMDIDPKPNRNVCSDCGEQPSAPIRLD